MFGFFQYTFLKIFTYLYEHGHRLAWSWTLDSVGHGWALSAGMGPLIFAATWAAGHGPLGYDTWVTVAPV